MQSSASNIRTAFEVLCERRNAARNSEHCENSVSPCVPRLIFISFPLAVFWEVSKGIVLSFNGVFWRAITHVFVKISERFPPSVANVDPSGSVIRKFWVRCFGASSNHVLPNLVDGRVARRFSVDVSERRKASTASRMACNEVAIEDCDLIPTFANTRASGPFFRGGILNYFKPSKCATDEGYFSRHGIGSFSALFSSGRPVATGAHCVIINHLH